MAFIPKLGGLMRTNILMRGSVHLRHAALSSTAAPEVQVENVAVVKPFEEIPGPNGIYNLPIIGPAFHFKPFTDVLPERSDKLIDRMFDKYGPIFKWRFSGICVMVCHPKDIEAVFRNEGRYPIRPLATLDPIYAERNKIKKGIAEVHGKEWHALRTPLNKRLMRVDSAHYYLEPQNAVADDFVKVLARNDKSPKELEEFFFSYAAESIGVVCFNTRLGFLDSDAMQNPVTSTFLKASRDAFVYSQQALFRSSHNWYRNKIYRLYEQTRYQLLENTMKHIEKAKQVLESHTKNGTLDPDEPNLLLSLLSDQSLEHADVIRMIETLYIGGTDSTAKNLQTFFYNLAVNPDKQEKLREEVISVLGQDNPLTGKDLAKMSYLKACLKESFRCLYPTMSGTGRVLATETVLSGYKVPAGTLVMIHNPRSCREHFSNPDKFIPERWLRSSDGNLKEEIPLMALLPFGNGPRNCIGRRFAEQEIYLAVSKVLQKLKIEVGPESIGTRFVYSLFIQPEKPINFKFTKLDG